MALFQEKIQDNHSSLLKVSYHICSNALDPKIQMFLTAVPCKTQTMFPTLKNFMTPFYYGILKGTYQLEKSPKDFWLGSPWAEYWPTTRVSQIYSSKT